MTTSGENSDDESSAFDNRVRTLNLLQNFGATVASCDPSLMTSGATSVVKSSGFDNSVRTLDILRNFGVVAAPNKASSVTRSGCLKRGPSLDLTLALPNIKKVKKIFCKSKLPCLPNPPPDMPRVFREHIESLGGQEVKMVMQKVLTCSDVSSHLARLLLPKNQIMRGGANFLRMGESDELNTDKDKGIAVGVFSSKLEEQELKFKLWLMGKKASAVGRPKPKATRVNVLQGGWVRFARENELRENDRIQLWSFRVDDESHHDSLKFAIVKLEGHDAEADVHPE